MLHSVGNQDSSWHQNWLSLPVRQFEYFCRYLKRKGFRTGHLNEWYEAIGKGEEADPKLVFMTFDDGYLDNWVIAAPILRKYKLKATVFVNPEFIDPSAGFRPTLEDLWEGRAEESELLKLGFMNWDEIKALDRSGTLDIQSHSMSHNYYFQSDKIIDVYEGQTDYHWMPWISHPDRKYKWLTEDQRSLVEPGTPVFEYGRALGLRRYFPDPEISELGRKLHQDSVGKEELISSCNDALQRHPGRFETDEEMRERFTYELSESKALLEKELSKPVDFLCWPGGGYRKESLDLAIEAGYKASTIASRDISTRIDNSKPYKRIRRFGMSAGFNGKKTYYVQKGKRWLVQVFHKGRGHFYYRYLLAFRQRLILIKEQWMK